MRDPASRRDGFAGEEESCWEEANASSREDIERAVLETCDVSFQTKKESNNTAHKRAMSRAAIPVVKESSPFSSIRRS